MKRLGLATVLLTAIFSWLVLLVAFQPFDRVGLAMDRAFADWKAWAHIEDTYSDPLTQEVSRSGAPLQSFQILAESWRARPDGVRIVLLGNSQTFITNLAAGEPPPSGPEKTYTSHIVDHYQQLGSCTLFYRLSAGGLSYEEILWYATYLVGRPEIRPNVLLVQLNYQGFATGGIRGGMLELLSDPVFRGRVEEIARSQRPHSAVFAKAVSEYQELQRRSSAPEASAAGASLGYRMETAVRKELDHISWFARRNVMKASFEEMLLRGRYYILRLGWSRKRSLRGSRVDANRAALEDLAVLCGRSGIRLILFHAPTNPAVPLYATSYDDRSYHDFATGLASRHGLTLWDFEHSIPANKWGMALNDPDPLHLGREGHRRMADLMIAALDKLALETGSGVTSETRGARRESAGMPPLRAPGKR